MITHDTFHLKATSCATGMKESSGRNPMATLPLRPHRQQLIGAAVAIALILPFAQDVRAQVISLQEVLSLIERQNPELQQSTKKAQALTEYVDGATAWMPPMVGVGTFMTPYPGQRVMEARDRGSVMFSIEQNIPNHAKQKATKSYLASRANVEQPQRAIRYNALRAAAKTYYYNHDSNIVYL